MGIENAYIHAWVYKMAVAITVVHSKRLVEVGELYVLSCSQHSESKVLRFFMGGHIGHLQLVATVISVNLNKISHEKFVHFKTMTLEF